MKRYEVFCKDRVGGQFWTVFVESTDEAKLADIFEFATMRTFGMDPIGVKENPSDPFMTHRHGDCILGLNF